MAVILWKVVCSHFQLFKKKIINVILIIIFTLLQSEV